MISEYYGVSSPTSDFIAHYGVKGMRWGVRKAIDSGNQRALDRHYRKAQKKLRKLENRANIENQEKLHRAHKANAISYGIGTALYPAAGHLMTGASKNAAFGRIAKKQNALANIPGLHLVTDTYNDYRPWGYVAGAASLGGAIGSGIAAYKAKQRTTKEGHAKAVAERDAWKKEMQSAFKGTKYGNSMRKSRKLSKKEQRQVQQGLKQWADAFEKHYQTGLSRGMSHEQAERYSNNYIAKNGFKPVNKSKRRK